MGWQQRRVGEGKIVKRLDMLYKSLNVSTSRLECMTLSWKKAWCGIVFWTWEHQIDRPWLDNVKRRNNVASAEFSKSYFLNQRMLRNTRAASHALIHTGGGVFRSFSWLSQKRQPAAVHNHKKTLLHDNTLCGKTQCSSECSVAMWFILFFACC